MLTYGLDMRGDLGFCPTGRKCRSKFRELFGELEEIEEEKQLHIDIFNEVLLQIYIYIVLLKKICIGMEDKRKNQKKSVVW